MIVTVRRQLLNAAIRLREEGQAPKNVDDVSLDKVRSASLRYGKGSDWKALSVEARLVREGTPAAAEVPLIV